MSTSNRIFSPVCIRTYVYWRHQGSRSAFRSLEEKQSWRWSIDKNEIYRKRLQGQLSGDDFAFDKLKDSLRTQQTVPSGGYRLNEKSRAFAAEFSSDISGSPEGSSGPGATVDVSNVSRFYIRIYTSFLRYSNQLRIIKEQFSIRRLLLDSTIVLRLRIFCHLVIYLPFRYILFHIFRSISNFCYRARVNVWRFYTTMKARWYDTKIKDKVARKERLKEDKIP